MLFKILTDCAVLQLTLQERDVVSMITSHDVGTVHETVQMNFYQEILWKMQTGHLGILITMNYRLRSEFLYKSKKTHKEANRKTN